MWLVLLVEAETPADPECGFGGPMGAMLVEVTVGGCPKTDTLPELTTDEPGMMGVPGAEFGLSPPTACSAVAAAATPPPPKLFPQLLLAAATADCCCCCCC